MTNNIRDREEYIINAYLHTDKLGLVQNPILSDNENVIEISTGILKLDIYESLDRSYLTGNISILDSQGIKEALSIEGVERLTLAIMYGGIEKPAPVIKHFIITGINGVIKRNDYLEILDLSFVEDFAYFGALNKISKTFQGTSEEIINNVCNNFLNKPLDTKSEKDIHLFQGEIRYIAPNINAFSILERILKKMSNVNGGPYFLYSTLLDNNLQLGELKYLLDQEEYNKEYPYLYSSTSMATEELENNVKIFNFTTPEFNNTFKMARDGLLNSELNIFDLLSGRSNKYSHKIKETIKNYIGKDAEPLVNGILFNPMDYSQNLLNTTSRSISVITSSRPFAESENMPMTEPSGYHDETYNPDNHKNKLTSPALKSILLNKQYNITIEGAPTIIHQQKNLQIGSVINVEYIKLGAPQVNIKDVNPYLDKDRSGKFLIYRIKHEFKDFKHRANLDIVKLAREK